MTIDVKNLLYERYLTLMSRVDLSPSPFLVRKGENESEEGLAPLLENCFPLLQGEGQGEVIDRALFQLSKNAFTPLIRNNAFA
jgi:hypothetical protein